MLIFLEITFWRSGPNVNTKLVNNLDYISQRNNMKGTFSVGQVEMFKDQLSPVYRDFLIYKQGVYQVRHAIIGWDTIDGKFLTSRKRMGIRLETKWCWVHICLYLDAF